MDHIRKNYLSWLFHLCCKCKYAKETKDLMTQITYICIAFILSISTAVNFAANSYYTIKTIPPNNKQLLADMYDKSIRFYDNSFLERSINTLLKDQLMKVEVLPKNGMERGIRAKILFTVAGRSEYLCWKTLKGVENAVFCDKKALKNKSNKSKFVWILEEKNGNYKIKSSDNVCLTLGGSDKKKGGNAYFAQTRPCKDTLRQVQFFTISTNGLRSNINEQKDEVDALDIVDEKKFT